MRNGFNSNTKLMGNRAGFIAGIFFKFHLVHVVNSIFEVVFDSMFIAHDVNTSSQPRFLLRLIN